MSRWFKWCQDEALKSYSTISTLDTSPAHLQNPLWARSKR